VDRESIESACHLAKQLDGPAAYHRCQNRQLAEVTGSGGGQAKSPASLATRSKNSAPQGVPSYAQRTSTGGTSGASTGPSSGVAKSTNSTQLSNNRYYTNSSGYAVHAPAKTLSGDVPSGASAVCRDGSYSFSMHHQGTCSHHGGVARWL
jgi:hypothetical protein